MDRATSLALTVVTSGARDSLCHLLGEFGSSWPGPRVGVLLSTCHHTAAPFAVSPVTQGGTGTLGSPAGDTAPLGGSVSREKEKGDVTHLTAGRPRDRVTRAEPGPALL